MSLLSLPNEILLNIIDLLNIPTFNHPSNKSLVISNPSNLQPIAATCSSLRRLCIGILYKYVIIGPGSYGMASLHSLVTSNPEIASSIRHITLGLSKMLYGAGALFTPFNIKWCQEILQRCPGLQSLHIAPGFRYHRPLIGDKERIPNFYLSNLSEVSNMLSNVNLDSKALIHTIELDNVTAPIVSFKLRRLNGFSSLKILNITNCGCVGGTLSLEPQCIGGIVQPLSLLTVEEFQLETHSCGAMPKKGRKNGQLLAASMPNVKKLTLSTTIHFIHGALEIYSEVGKSLKWLSICPKVARSHKLDAHQSHLCGFIAALSPQLVDFRILVGNNRGNWFCHEMFAGEWTKLEHLCFNQCMFPWGCAGMDLEQLRSSLERVLKSSLVADISVWRYSGEASNQDSKLISKKSRCKEYYLAPELFICPCGLDTYLDSLYPAVISQETPVT